MKDVVLTGLRTNGDYHLGNYLGALMPMVQFANEKSDSYQVNLFAPDLHSFTTPIEFGESFNAQTMANLKLFVAAGVPLNNPNVCIYRQSRVPAHSELAWLLDNFTGVGEMERMTEYKDKRNKLAHGIVEVSAVVGVDTAKNTLKHAATEFSKEVNKRISVGLFNYPVLMSADILLYGAKWVPVGDDQRQHLEFTRTIAERMNNQFGELFVVPETINKQQEFVGRTDAPRIRSLRNPDKKMSKSVNDPSGTILLSDSPEDARKKIMSAETDSIGRINFDWDNQPGITNMLTILALLTNKPQADVNVDWIGKDRYGDLKTTVAEVVASFLTELQAKLADVDENALLDHLEASEAKMNEIANAKLQEVQKAIGLR